VRRHYGLPLDAATLGLEPIREREYIEAVERVRAAVDRARPESERLVAELERAHPRLPGAALLRCELLGRQNKPAAFKPCVQAVAQMDELPAAHFYAAVSADRMGKTAAAISHLRRVIELEPGTRDAWMFLAELHRRQRAGSELRTLAASYERRFGSKLR
jgi:predicted Zn-dependent protease